jgi:peptidoglycan/xylan/chitin deacetylase (PgdA/CDA1 family)
VTAAFKSFVKQGLLTAGYYSRALRKTVFPGVAVFCYHGVRDDRLPQGSIPFQYLHIPESTFDSHCRLIRGSCDPISLDDWRAATSGGPALPARPVLITFDDGYRSVLTKAAPILANHGLPAAVFVCTGPMALRTRLWFDAVGERDGESAVEAWKSRDHQTWAAACLTTETLSEGDPRALMTPDELSKLASVPGIEIGGHTVNHSILTQSPLERQREEIEGNLQSIRQWTGKPVRTFAYPNGRPGIDYNEQAIGILRDNGIDIAFSTRPDFARADEHPFERSRFLLLDEMSDSELAHRMAYSWPR